MEQDLKSIKILSC